MAKAYANGNLAAALFIEEQQRQAGMALLVVNAQRIRREREESEQPSRGQLAARPSESEPSGRR